ncbi:PAS domain S-box protein [Sphingomonas sp. XMGL2]|uniref:PAS domain S-box protein n=2 Tax=Sphingomonas quercus TaxID=2842451 RepID=A0ABS6BJT3_9SPHN|nr:PAS domain S-box protein [Sphingomonas quercus]
MATLMLTGGVDGVAALWPANAVLITAIIRLPRERRIPYLLLCTLASAAANHQAQLPATAVLGFTVANIAEAALAATLFDRLCPARHLVTTLRHLGAFSIAAVLSAATSATVAAVAAATAIRDLSGFWVSWFTTDTLGMFMIVPPGLMIIALLQRDPQVRVRRGPIEVTAVLAAVLAVNLVVFALPPYPLTFLPLAALLLATARLGPLGTTVSLLITAVVGSLLTAAGKGPLAPIADTAEAVLLFQFYLVILFAASLPIASLLASQRETITETDRSERFHRSIIDRTHALFFETDAEGRWTFLSPAWTELTGTPVAEAIGASFEAIIHPDDHAKGLGLIERLRATDDGEEAIDVRYRAADGSWRWVAVRATRLADKAGAFTGLFGTLIDIDDRVTAEQARSESERLYRLLADNSNDMIFRVGLDGVRTYASPACRTVLGWEPEELIGRQALDTIHPDDRTVTRAAASSLLDGVAAPTAIYRQRRRDGAYVWLEATYRLVRDPETGAPKEFVSTVRDISRRQEAELEAVETAARLNENYRLLMMTEAMAHVGHWRLDNVTKDLFWSDEVFRIYGVPAGSPVSLDMAQAALHPDDRETMRGLLEAGAGYVQAARIIRPDGEERHIATQGQPDIAPDGTVIGMFGVIQDITDQAKAEAKLRESEAQYRLLAEHASDIIFRLDAEGRYLYVSPATEALTGYAPEEMIGQRPSDYAHAEDVPKVRETLKSLHLAGGGQCVVSYRRRRKDGSWQWLEASARLATSVDGAAEIVGIARDISDRKRFEAELLNAREAAERAAHEARQIAATDELTGLASRRMFMGRLVGEVTAAAATATPLSVALLDVDHFKLVNDRYGHAVGDRVLRAIAATATRAVRGHDVIGRIGGEEFAILMPRTTAEAAALVGERLRLAVEASGEEHPELPRVTVSIGIASLVDGSDAASLLAAADYALYTAKAEGRNLLRLAS